MHTRNGYSGTQITLHWAIAVLILFNYIYSEGMEKALDARLEGAFLTNPEINPWIHVWVGMAVLLLTGLRLWLRMGRGVPQAGGSGWTQTAATWAHRALYLLMILVAVMGGLTWFGRIEETGDIHAVLANALMILAGGHAVMAIWHQFIIRDGLLTRMTRPSN